jgi:hypothetical protein
MHCWVTGAGVTHRQGPATERPDANGREADKTAEEPKSDGARLHAAGLAGGKPAPGELGAHTEWFYKGNGACVVASERPLAAPDFALSCGEEAEIVALYIIDGDGMPWRLGFALGNDFSDHALEEQNCLLLGHAKLRSCALGPELVTGPLPESLEGTSRVLRGGQVLWEKVVRSGEANMTHSLANIENHHFKYPHFLQPWTVHVHYLGAMGLSFVDGIRPQVGDVFEIAVAGFGRPLRNPIARIRSTTRQIRSL